MEQMQNDKMPNEGTIFDDVFRTMVQKMPQLLIPLINEVFHTQYSEEDIIEQRRNEYMEKFGKIGTDSILFIRDKTYHIECQSVDDTTMALRMVEYDFAIALESVVKTGRVYEMNFPDSCMLFLRCSSNTPDLLEVKVNLPNGKSFLYEAKTLKLANYTRDDIFQKRLLFLLPFYIIRYETQVAEMETDHEKLDILLDEYRNIQEQLMVCLQKEDEFVLYADLVKLIIKISDYVLYRAETAKKGVSEVMGGKILELESERLQRVGREQGLEQGEQNAMKLITKLFALGRSSDAELAAKDEEARRRFYKEFGIID